MPDNDLGAQISKTIESVLNSQGIADLKHSINAALGEAARTASRGASDFYNEAERAARRAMGSPAAAPAKKAVARISKKGSAAGVVMKVFASIGIGISASLGLAWFITMMAAVDPGVVTGLAGGAATVLAASVPLMLRGNALSRRYKRYELYWRVLEGRTGCSVRQLSNATGKSPRFIARELRAMTNEGMFREGYLDESEDYFLTDYGALLHHNAQRTNARQLASAPQAPTPLPAPETEPQERSMRAERDHYTAALREANDALPGEDISNELAQLEERIGKIFDYVEKHPDKAGEIRRFMCYYLPTTLKLVSAYREFDAHDTGSADIARSKAEIITALGMINQAFDKLMVKLMQDAALDVSTDISALQTILAQEGLAGRQMFE